MPTGQMDTAFQRRYSCSVKCILVRQSGVFGVTQTKNYSRTWKHLKVNSNRTKINSSRSTKRSTQAVHPVTSQVHHPVRSRALQPVTISQVHLTSNRVNRVHALNPLMMHLSVKLHGSSNHATALTSNITNHCVAVEYTPCAFQPEIFLYKSTVTWILTEGDGRSVLCMFCCLSHALRCCSS